MSATLTFYTNPMSRARIVRWMLEEVAQPYRTEVLAYGDAGLKAPAFLAVNPMGKVPALRHGDHVVTEGAAICAYLADAFPGAGLAPPPGSVERAAYYRWLFFAAGPLEAALTNKVLGTVVPPGRERMVGYGSLAAVVDVLDGALDDALTRDGYLAGDRFTAADLYLGSQVGFGMMFGTLEKRPSFERYWARLAARPAAVRARAIDDALLPPEQRTEASR